MVTPAQLAQRVVARFVGVKPTLAQRVAARYAAALKMPEPGNWTIQELERWHAQSPKPKSVYDKVPDRMRPFDWSTPAPVISGEMPKPWRVAHADRAGILLSRLFPQYDDIYVDYGDGLFRGRLQLWVGLRDNRDAVAHAARTEELADGLQKAHFKIRYQHPGNRPVLYLVDDLERDILKK